MSKLVIFLKFVIPCLLLGIMSCTSQSSSDVLSESTMEDVLYDYHLALSMAARQGGDIDKQRYLNVQNVFLKYGITEAEFDSSMIWYSSNSARLAAIYQRVSERFDGESKGLGVGVSESEVSANTIAQGEYDIIWRNNKLLVLQNDYLNCLSTITMTADSTFLPGDNYELNFTDTIIGSARSDAHAFLSVFYKDGSSKSVTQRLHSSDCSLVLPEDINNNDRETERIVITFYFSYANATDHSILLIRDPALLRRHRKETKTFGVPSATADSIKSAETIQPITKDSMPLDEGEAVIPVKDESGRSGFDLQRERKVHRPMRPVRR